MVDLKGQYNKIKDQIDTAVIQTIESTSFINGPVVKEFSSSLAEYLDVKYVIPCANGTDALQIALISIYLTNHLNILPAHISRFSKPGTVYHYR